MPTTQSCDRLWVVFMLVSYGLGAGLFCGFHFLGHKLEGTLSHKLPVTLAFQHLGEVRDMVDSCIAFSHVYMFGLGLISLGR
jgi:hypothetical protein